jgi:hypothetical protein
VQFPDVEEIRNLLKTPTAENVSAAIVKLDALASFVAAAKQSFESGEPFDPSLPAFLADLRQETARIRHLLESAAKFFNGLNALAEATGYQRDGLLSPQSPGRRTLAQL